MIFLLPPSLGAVKVNARARMLRAVLSSWFDTECTVELADDYATIRDKILKGDVHLAWAPPIVCAQVESQVRAILKAVRSGRSTYRAALIARRIDRTLADLEGGRAAWVDQLSAAGYLLAAEYLRSKGMPPETFFATQRFVGSYHNALITVARDEADVTSVYVLDADTGAAEQTVKGILGTRGESLHAVGYTGETSNDGLVVTAAVSGEQTAEIINRITAQPPQMLLEALNLDALIRAEPNAYAVLRAVTAADG